MPRGTAALRLTTQPAQFEAKSECTLIIGDINRWGATGRITHSCESFEFCRLDDLRADTLFRLAPQLVLSPLVGDDFDAVEVAIVLQRLCYKGRYRAISPYLPRCAIIRAEVASVAPDIDFEILVLPDKSA